VRCDLISQGSLPKPSGFPLSVLAAMISYDRQIPTFDCGASVCAAAERAKEARKEAERLACDAWNKRMHGFRGPAQPSPTLGDALKAGT